MASLLQFLVVCGGFHRLMRQTEVHHLQKDKVEILRFPAKTLSSLCLCLKIWSMNIAMRVIEEGQPWLSPASSHLNIIDFVYGMQTQLSPPPLQTCKGKNLAQCSNGRAESALLSLS